MSIRDVLRKYEGRNRRSEEPAAEQTSPREVAHSPEPPREISILDISLDEFANSGRIFRVRSRLLAEDVWFVANSSLMKKVPDPSLVIYTAAELRKLTRISPDDLLRIHKIKKTFDGAIEN